MAPGRAPLNGCSRSCCSQEETAPRLYWRWHVLHGGQVCLLFASVKFYHTLFHSYSHPIPQTKQISD